MIRPEFGLAFSTGMSVFAMVATMMGASLKVNVNRVYECFCKVIPMVNESQCEEALDSIFYKNYSISNVTHLCHDDLPFKESESIFIMVISVLVVIFFGVIFAKSYRALNDESEFPPLVLGEKY